MVDLGSCCLRNGVRIVSKTSRSSLPRHRARRHTIGAFSRASLESLDLSNSGAPYCNINTVRVRSLFQVLISALISRAVLQKIKEAFGESAGLL
jgi:hypothetical protein